MNTKILIAIPIIIGAAISFPLVLNSLPPKTIQDTLQTEIEDDFLEKIRQTGDTSNTMTFMINKNQDLFTGIDHYCGFAHMETEEYWYFADAKDDQILSSYVTQDVSLWCDGVENSCYCELSEYLGMDTPSYEEFFREHVSSTCPVIPMPDNAESFDPVKCMWVLEHE